MNQADILKKLPGEQRVIQACELSDFVRALALNNIRKASEGKLTKKQELDKLHNRLTLMWDKERSF